MFDPFATAIDSIFSTQVAVAGILTDSTNNQYDVRCVVQTSLAFALQGYASPVRDDKITITVSKGSIGVVLSRDAYHSLELNDKTYRVDGVALEDEYSITLYCLEE